MTRYVCVCDVHGADGRPLAVRRIECNDYRDARSWYTEIASDYPGFEMDDIWPYMTSDGTFVEVTHMVPRGARA